MLSEKMNGWNNYTKFYDKKMNNHVIELMPAQINQQLRLSILLVKRFIVSLIMMDFKFFIRRFGTAPRKTK